MTPAEQAAKAATSSTAAKTLPKEQGTGWIICRVCGYIEDAKYKDQPCPACGFPPTVWMEYKPRRLSPKREKMLNTSNLCSFSNRWYYRFFLCSYYCIIDSINCTNIIPCCYISNYDITGSRYSRWYFRIYW